MRFVATVRGCLFTVFNEVIFLDSIRLSRWSLAEISNATVLRARCGLRDSYVTPSTGRVDGIGRALSLQLLDPIRRIIRVLYGV